MFVLACIGAAMVLRWVGRGISRAAQASGRVVLGLARRLGEWIKRITIARARVVDHRQRGAERQLADANARLVAMLADARAEIAALRVDPGSASSTTVYVAPEWLS